MDSTLKCGVDATNFSLCIVCQLKSTTELSVSGETGWQSIQNATKSRKRCFDSVYSEAIQRIELINSIPEGIQIFYHRSCYEKFTNKSKIARLKNKCVSGDARQMECSRITTRSAVHHNFDKLLCLICQENKNPKHLRNTSTFNVNDKIESLARFDYDLKRRTLGALDAMAGDLVYHTYCLKNKEKELERAKLSESDPNLSYLQLCFELNASAQKGQILTLEAAFQRYETLANGIDETVPQRYLSRMSTFREALERSLGSVFHFFRPLDRDIRERGTILISRQYKYSTTEKLQDGDNEIPSYVPQEGTGFKEIVHVALYLRGILKSVVNYQGLGVTKHDVSSLIPKELFLFLSILIGGSDPLEQVEMALDGTSTDMDAMDLHRMQSLAQDMIYASSKGRKLTPKHIGLGMTLRAQSRKKDIVNLFSKAGHCASYEQVLQIETALATFSLKSYDSVTGAVVPSNLRSAPESCDPLEKPTPILHMTADNVDIQMDSLDSKKSFHGTQMVAFQRGCQNTDDVLRSIHRSASKCVNLPDGLNRIIRSSVIPGKVDPVFSRPVQTKWYDPEDPPVAFQEAENLDLAFLAHRGCDPKRIGWTEFNKSICRSDPDISHPAYMPLLLQPAHEMSTLNTVLQRTLHVADKLNYNYIVLTVDQQLYCRLLELIWANEIYRKKVILRMGGLHLSMNFLKAIGQHMSESGLLEVWVESNLLSEASGKKIEEGKAYGKAMRAHKLTLQALWRIIESDFMAFLKKEHSDAAAEVEEKKLNVMDLYAVLRRYNAVTFLEKFVDGHQNINLKFWWTYMKMVMILLRFTRSMREGIWDLYLHSLSEMLPFLARYDHHNYLKSLPIYIAEMRQLPTEIEAAFKRGEFVVKRAKGVFNQVDPDHAQEWIVHDVKTSGGIAGIIQTDTALSRWALTYNWRADISLKTKELYDMTSRTDPHSELLPGRRARDCKDEDSIYAVFQEFGIFDPKYLDSLRNVATKDVASAEIVDSLLNSEKYGRNVALKFVEERLCESLSDYHKSVSLIRPQTFQDLYKSRALTKQAAERKKTKESTSVLQRVIRAFDAGRSVNLSSILKHELYDFPPSLADSSTSLRTGNKADLLKVMVKNTDCPVSIDISGGTSHLIIDGQALVMATGKPAKAKTFGDLSKVFISKIKQMGEGYKRIDIVFDRYNEQSIKSGTRTKRASKVRPIRKTVDSGNIPLPSNWDSYIMLAHNKAELSNFLSTEIISCGFVDVDIVVAGGFEDVSKTISTCPEINTAPLESNHEEADTRLILHAINSPFDKVVLSVRDTDVFVLLVHFFSKMQCSECWMMSGTNTSPTYVPIHSVCNALPADILRNLPAFHALTGCDTTSFLASIGKRGGYSVFLQHSVLLNGLGVEPLTEKTMENAEKFVVRLYTSDDLIKSADEARYSLFGRSSKPEALPPTSDALGLHLQRVHYQALIWRTADIATQNVPVATDYGWLLQNDKLTPKLMTLDAVPKACEALISCGCKSGCATMRCKCRRTLDEDGESLSCIQSCKCRGLCSNGISK